MPKLTIMRGISGSGKSTYARTLDGVVVSRDDLRAALFGSDGKDYYDRADLRRCEEVVTKMEYDLIKNAIEGGLDVVSDNTNVEWKFVRKLAEFAIGLGAAVEIKVMDTPLDVAISRAKSRAIAGGRDVPEAVIRKQHSRLQGTLNKGLDDLPKPFIPEPYNGTPGKPKAFIFDIDGTIAHNNGHRGWYDWSEVGGDDIDEVVATVVDSVRFSESAHYAVSIAMSGRDEICRPETEAWLRKHNIHFDHLFMRLNKDQRKDNIVKEELFNTYVRDNFDVQFVVDDRWQVCKMWLQKGLKVLNVSGLDRGEF